MRTLCVVPCGKAKIWDKYPKAGPREAREVYTGSFAKKCREYAERFYGEEYVILSAKYGFLRPDEVIEGTYNVSFNDPKSKPIGVRALKEQAREKGLLGYERIVVLGGKNYQGMAEETCPDPALAPFLGDTYGLMVYEEQILRVAHGFAGMDLGRADLLRRALVKQHDPHEVARYEAFRRARPGGLVGPAPGG